MTVDEVLSIARKEVGTTEYPPNSNNVKYNTWYYGHPVSGDKYPWCVTFIQWLFQSQLLQMLFIKTASSSALLTEFEKRGLVVCENLKSPGVPLKEVLDKTLPGDIVFLKFNWKRDCKAEHVGLACGKDSALLTAEGNTSFDDRGSQDNGGAVALRHRKSNIVAVVRPRYEKGSNPTPVKKKTVEEIAKEVIDGKWSCGNARRQKLAAAGYNYQEVQSMVNKILKG